MTRQLDAVLGDAPTGDGVEGAAAVDKAREEALTHAVRLLLDVGHLGEGMSRHVTACNGM